MSILSCRHVQYTAITDEEVKSQIFSDAAAPLRVDVLMFGKLYTLAYRMTETYIQETGRAGQDGKLSLAILVITKSATRNADKSMREYQTNDVVCRRDYLFSYMDKYVHDLQVEIYVLRLVFVVLVLENDLNLC